MPVPEGPGDFFLTELLGNLPAAQLSENLLIAVQYATGQGGWMKLSLSQLLASTGTGGNIMAMDGGNASKSNVVPPRDTLDGGNVGANTAQLEGGSAATANTSNINGGNAQ